MPSRRLLAVECLLAIKIEVKRAIASAMAFLDEPKAHPGIEQIYLGECTGYNKFESDPDKRVKLDPSSQDITLIHQYCLEIFIGHLRGRGQLYGLGDEWMKSIASSVCSYWSSEDGLPPWLVITRRRKLSPKDSEDDASKKTENRKRLLGSHWESGGKTAGRTEKTEK